MQKLLSFLIMFILSVFPIVNAAAAPSSCEHMMDESLSMTQPIVDETIADAIETDNTTMLLIDGCCEIGKVICDHNNACDCDNSQVNYSTLPPLQIVNSQYLESYKPHYSYPQFHSNISDSLYRPPINILL